MPGYGAGWRAPAAREPATAPRSRWWWRSSGVSRRRPGSRRPGSRRPGSRLCALAGHQHADLLWQCGVGAGGDLADDPAAVHHPDPVGEAEDLVELAGDEDDRGAVVA